MYPGSSCTLTFSLVYFTYGTIRTGPDTGKPTDKSGSCSLLVKMDWNELWYDEKHQEYKICQFPKFFDYPVWCIYPQHNVHLLLICAYSGSDLLLIHHLLPLVCFGKLFCIHTEVKCTKVRVWVSWGVRSKADQDLFVWYTPSSLLAAWENEHGSKSDLRVWMYLN